MAEVWSYPKLLHDVSKHLRSRCTIKLLFVCYLFSVPIFSGFCYEYCYWGPERNSIFQPGSPTNSITSVFSRLVVVVVGGFPLNVPGKKKLTITSVQRTPFISKLGAAPWRRKEISSGATTHEPHCCLHIYVFNRRSHTRALAKGIVWTISAGISIPKGVQGPTDDIPTISCTQRLLLYPEKLTIFQTNANL